MTQCEDLLILLREGPVTPLQSWAELGIYRLGARIYDLRRKGYVIDLEVKPYTTTRGRKISLSHYFLRTEPRKAYPRIDWEMPV